ncbi:hypothetical protein [Hymenobacter convexus]|uniref:hypothetical protein n=1 Tax=Hymenobacter sp. CA1UV-4 TaxID=3063782 RepID=UPI0027129E62|nr:hypothetical protein [Hymenobacter sp. CA1UV-4]MDO7852522.1 hypothetical protein [Hymenobacter sp. CA1UV-4]
MKTSVHPPRPRKPALVQWSAFGASILAGLTAGVLWAPASGRHSRTRLAAGFRDWSHPVAGRWNLWKPWPLACPARHRLPAAAHPAPAPDLSMQPNRLLTED